MAARTGPASHNLDHLMLSPLSRHLAHLRAKPLARYNKSMFRDLAPLFSYMRRYRSGYVWGTLACVGTHSVSGQFPRVLVIAVDATEKGTTRQHGLMFALIVVAITFIKG